MTATMGALAQRALPPIVQIILASQPLPPARVTTMTVSLVVEETVGEVGIECWAVGTGPNGEQVTAVGGETPPQVGEVWRCVCNEAGLCWLDDLVRVA